MTARNGTKNEQAAPNTPAPPEGRLRLLAVHVQPVLVLDDGTLRPVNHDPIEIKAVDWHAWAQNAYTDDDLESLRLKLTATSD